MKYLPRELQVVTERPSKNFENKGSHMICDCHAILELSFLLQDFAYFCEKKREIQRSYKLDRHRSLLF